jgi:hypothetical protein
MKYSVVTRHDTVIVYFSEKSISTNKSLIDRLKEINGVEILHDYMSPQSFEKSIFIRRQPYVTLNDIQVCIEYWLKSNVEEFEYVEAYS